MSVTNALLLRPAGNIVLCQFFGALLPQFPIDLALYLDRGVFGPYSVSVPLISALLPHIGLKADSIFP